MARHALIGSSRTHLAGANIVGRSDPAERLEVTVRLRRRNQAAFDDRLASLAAGTASHLSHEEFADQFAADPADIASVEAFAASHGLSTVQKDAVRRSVVLSGTVAEFNAAFGVDLQQVEHDGGTYRGREGEIFLPDELAGKVEAVLGLDNRPAAQPHFRRRLPHAAANAAGAAASSSFTPNQVAELYQFPAGDGDGQTVALIELGGGFRKTDLTRYFGGLGIATPKVVAVSVDHAKNHPSGGVDGPDGEVMLDIEVLGAVAPKATIVAYFAPNTDAGFLNAITTAIHDPTHKPAVVSISWGGPESSWTQQALASFDQAFQAAAVLGVTVVVAAGDNGSSDGVKSGDAVDFPASSPHALAAGGTRLAAANGVITGESVWNDGAKGGAGGGGVSAVFALPAWQAGLSATRTGGAASPLVRRGVPDIAGDADPQSGYAVRVDGTDTVFGGTSAVAPLWAGLIAIINGLTGKQAGFVNPTLYKNPHAMNDVTTGNNGDFEATVGWDATTGLGTPKGKALAALL